MPRQLRFWFIYRSVSRFAALLAVSGLLAARQMCYTRGVYGGSSSSSNDILSKAISVWWRRLDTACWLSILGIRLCNWVDEVALKIGCPFAVW